METELERLVVRLVGDSSDYQKMLQGAQEQTATTARAIETSTNQVGQSFSQLGTAVTGALAAFGITSGIRTALANFQEAELIGIRLNAVLEANGREVETVRASYDQFARTMELLTTEEDDQILKMLQVAETFRVSGDAAQRAVQNAVSLAAVTGNSAESMLRFTTALERGDIKGAQRFARFIPQLRGITDQSKFAAEAAKLIQVGWKAAGAEAESSAGQFKIVRRDLGNMLEEFGQIVAESVAPIMTFFADLIQRIRQLDPSIKRVIVALVSLTGVGATLAPVMALFNAFGPALLSLINPVRLLITAFGLLRVAVSTAFGPVGLIILAAIALVQMFSEEVGGLGDVWKNVQDFAMQAWQAIRQAIASFIEWAQPIFKALWGVWRAAVESAWEIVKATFIAVRDFIIGVFEFISGRSNLTWTDIRDFIVEALIKAEFVIRNFGRIVQHTWIGIRLGFARFVNEIEFFFTTTMPRLIVQFVDQWGDLIEGTLSGIGSPFANAFRAMRRGFATLPRDLGRNIVRAMGPVEAQLQREFDELSGELARDFAAFRARRLREILGEAGAAAAEAAQVAANAINNTARDMNDAAKAAARFEAALTGSAEAATRVAEFSEGIFEMRRRALGGVQTPAVAAAARAAEQGRPVREKFAEPLPDFAIQDFHERFREQMQAGGGGAFGAVGAAVNFFAEQFRRQQEFAEQAAAAAQAREMAERVGLTLMQTAAAEQMRERANRDAAIAAAAQAREMTERVNMTLLQQAAGEQLRERAARDAAEALRPGAFGEGPRGGGAERPGFGGVPEPGQEQIVQVLNRIREGIDILTRTRPITVGVGIFGD